MVTGILTFTKRMEINARFIGAFFLLGIFFLLDLVSFNIPFFASVRPSFFLMVIFYWSIFRPTMIPGWMVFCAGLFYDLISGIPVGLNALLYFLVRISITEQRKVFSGQSFAVVYLGYVAVAAIFLSVIRLFNTFDCVFSASIFNDEFNS